MFRSVTNRGDADLDDDAETGSAPSLARTPRISPIWYLITIALAAFLPVCHYAYVDWDDPLHVYQNPYLNPITPAHLIHFWRAPYEGLYVPVSYMAFGLLARLGRMPHTALTPSGGLTDLDPHVFHSANLILHLANIVLVFAILRVVLRRDWPSAVGALVFGIHPIQVESVAWISELRGLLATFFALIAIREFLLYVTERGRRHSILAVVAYGTALLAKPSVIPVPLIALLLGWLAARNDIRRGAWVLAAWSVLIVPCILAAHSAQPVSGAYVVPIWQRPFVAGDALAFYIGKLLWPVWLGEDYGRSPNTVVAHWQTYLIWLIPVIITAAAWRWRHRYGVAAVAWALFVAALSPNLGLMPFIFQRFSTVADRYAYLGMLGPALFGAWAVDRCLQRYPARKVRIACAVLLMSMWVMTSIQTRYWRDSVALFEHSVAVNPSSSVMHSDLGRAFAINGDNTRAEAEFRTAIHLQPSNDQAHFNLGVALADSGDIVGAIREYRTANGIEPRNAKAHCNLGGLLAARQDVNGAMAEYRQAVTVDPNLAEAHYGLALLLAQTGRLSDAVEQWNDTTRLWPGSAAAHYNLGIAQYQIGDLTDSVHALQTAVALDPSQTQARQALQFVLAKQQRARPG